MFLPKSNAVWEYLPESDMIVGAYGIPIVRGIDKEDGPVIAASRELRDALDDVMSWISNWDPNFIHDSEWPASRERALAALAKAKGGAQ